jgi:hypothetical protein
MMLSLKVSLVALGLSAAPSPNTKTTMHDALEALVSLEGATTMHGGLRDQASRAKVGEWLGVIAGLPHAFPADAAGQEPATAAISGLVARYAKETQARVAEGRIDQVPMRVHTLTSLCFSCHSREKAGTDFTDVRRRIQALGGAGLQRAQLLAATRQFELALTEYKTLLGRAPTTEAERLEQHRAVSDALALTVRVRDDPEASLEMLTLVEAQPSTSSWLKGAVVAWRRDVKAWEKEKFDAGAAKPEVLFKKGQALVLEAKGPTTFFSDGRRDVAFLRASGYLNLALAKNPKLATRGEALWLLGLCASALQSPLTWEVDGLFFEACVRENPKSKVSQACFEQLDQRITLGFTGSGGTRVPEDELARLAELRAIAF